jgi:hypothetical protein
VDARPSHPSAGPILGAARSAERGCTGRAGRCSRLGRRFGFPRRRAPSVRHRRRGVCHCASAQPCLDCSPPKQGKRCSASPYPPVGVDVVVWGRLTPAQVLSPVVLSAVVGAGLGVARRARPHRGRRAVGCRASPDRRAGRGVQGSCEPARSAAGDPGPGGRLAMTKLLARVAGSSVSLNCPCADQGGRHVDMVVGADHRGRAGVGVWRDAASSRLTAWRHWPVTVGAPAGSGRRPDSGAGGSRPSGPQSTTPALLGPPGLGTTRGWGQWCSATASSSLLEGRIGWPRGAISGACLGCTPLSRLG